MSSEKAPWYVEWWALSCQVDQIFAFSWNKNTSGSKWRCFHKSIIYEGFCVWNDVSFPSSWILICFQTDSIHTSALSHFSPKYKSFTILWHYIACIGNEIHISLTIPKSSHNKAISDLTGWTSISNNNKNWNLCFLLHFLHTCICLVKPSISLTSYRGICNHHAAVKYLCKNLAEGGFQLNVLQIYTDGLKIYIFGHYVLWEEKHFIIIENWSL